MYTSALLALAFAAGPVLSWPQNPCQEACEDTFNAKGACPSGEAVCRAAYDKCWDACPTSPGKTLEAIDPFAPLATPVCIPKPNANGGSVYAAVNWACKSGGIGGCDDVPAECHGDKGTDGQYSHQGHATYVFSKYYVLKAGTGGTCDFSGNAMMSRTPAFKQCIFPGAISGGLGPVDVVPAPAPEFQVLEDAPVDPECKAKEDVTTAVETLQHAFSFALDGLKDLEDLPFIGNAAKTAANVLTDGKAVLDSEASELEDKACATCKEIQTVFDAAKEKIEKGIDGIGNTAISSAVDGVLDTIDSGFEMLCPADPAELFAPQEAMLGAPLMCYFKDQLCDLAVATVSRHVIGSIGGCTGIAGNAADICRKATGGRFQQLSRPCEDLVSRVVEKGCENAVYHGQTFASWKCKQVVTDYCNSHAAVTGAAVAAY